MSKLTPSPRYLVTILWHCIHEPRQRALRGKWDDGYEGGHKYDCHGRLQTGLMWVSNTLEDCNVEEE